MAKLKHIGLLQFKEGTPPEQVDQVFDQILELTENIEGIEDYVSGENCSPEQLGQGHTHAYVMSFESAQARDAYLGHPEYQRIKEALTPLTEKVTIVDFEI